MHMVPGQCECRLGNDSSIAHSCQPASLKHTSVHNESIDWHAARLDAAQTSMFDTVSHWRLSQSSLLKSCSPFGEQGHDSTLFTLDGLGANQTQYVQH